MQLDFPYYVIDLTHTLDKETPSWNGSCGFRAELKADYSDFKEDVKFKIQSLKMHAGIGTHLDAPSHACEGGLDVEQLSLNDLISPCFVVDVSAKANENYILSLEDLQAFEKQFGSISPHSFVLFRTGWEKHWSHPKKYHNHHCFPSISREVAQYLLDRSIKGIGIDTLSPDCPGSGFPVHELLLGSGKYIVENVANLKALPIRGSFVLVAPIKIRGCTEAPVRLIGLIPK